MEISIESRFGMVPPTECVMFTREDGTHFYGFRDEDTKEETIYNAHIYNRVKWGDEDVKLNVPVISTSETLKAPLTGEMCTYYTEIEMR